MASPLSKLPLRSRSANETDTPGVVPEREFLSVLMDNLSEAIVACDAQSNLVLFNRAAQRVHGLPPEPGPADGWSAHYSLFEADGRTPLATERIPLLRAFRGETVRDQQMVIAPAGLPPRTMRVNAQRITAPDGSMLGAVAAMHDITAQKAYEAQLFEAKELAQITLAAIADGVIRTNRAGVIEFCNDAALHLLQAEPQQLIGERLDTALTFCDASGKPLSASPIATVMEGTAVQQSAIFQEIRSGTGVTRRIAYAIAPLRSIEGECIGSVLVLQDMSEAHELTQKLMSQARTDVLTSLPNRLAFEEHLGNWLRLPVQERLGVYLFYLDLDHFKVVNDTLGHLAGDQLLQELTAHLRLALRPEDFLARIGGDEFSILCRVDDPAAADALAAKLIGIVAGYRFKVQDRLFEVGLSIGIVSLDEPSSTADEFLSKADTACYVAKDLGRGRYCRYSERDVFIRSYNRRNVVAQAMQRAFESQGFQLYLERIVTAEGAVLGHEVLVRMVDSHGVLLMPMEFLPVAQQMGWGSRLDRWVIEHAISLLYGRLDGRPCTRVPEQQMLSINVSARSLDDAPFVAWLLGFLETYPQLKQGARRRLHLEITETEYLAPTSDGGTAIAALQAVGAEVWLDDFGAGYNSFELLKRVRVDGVKIDRSFVNDLGNDPVDAAMIRAIAGLAAQLGFEVVAEGVDGQETVQQLKAMGINAFQGWMFHRACSVEQALAS